MAEDRKRGNISFASPRRHTDATLSALFFLSQMQWCIFKFLVMIKGLIYVVPSLT